MLARLFLIQAERMGHPELGLLIANMRSTTGDERDVVLLGLDDLPVASEPDAKEMIQNSVDAYDALLRSGFDPKAERAAKKKAGFDDPGLFR